MKQKILFLAVMLWMACTAVQAETASLKIKGQEVDMSLGGADVGNITLVVNEFNSQKHLTVFLGPDEEGGDYIDVPEGECLFTYNGDDYQYIKIVLPDDLTVNTYNRGAFAFIGRSNNILYVSFYSGANKDVTLTLNHVSNDDYIRPLFYLGYANVSLNEFDTYRVDMNMLNYDENGQVFYCQYPSTLRLGYGDYHIVNRYGEDQGGGVGVASYNFFDPKLTVVGLQEGDNIYYAEGDNIDNTEPYIGAHVRSGYALVDCNGRQIMGEVTLTYLPQGYQSIEGSDAEWLITQSCEDSIKLVVYGAGDMSEIGEYDLGWLKYKDIITKIEVLAFAMYDPFTALPEFAFAEMTNLRSVQFYQTYHLNKLSYCLFADCPKLEEVDMSYYNGDLKEIDTYAFGSCKSLKSFTIPETVETIGRQAFENCESLTSMTIPDKATDIGINIFQGCTNLTTVTLPEDLTDIEWGMFSGCKKLSSITLPSSVSKIGHFAFRDCEQLKSISLPDGITDIYNDAFAGTGLTEVTLPKSLEYIEVGAFATNSLTKVIIPAGIKEVEAKGSMWYGGIPSFLAVNDIRFGGDAAQWLSYDWSWLMKYVAGDTRLYFDGEEAEKVTVPASITEVPAYAFRNVGSLTEITLPKSLTEIGAEAFAGCTNIQNIYTYAWNPPALGTNAFEGVNGTVTPWYTAGDNYKEDEGWGSMPIYDAGDNWPLQLRDFIITVELMEGQEALGSVGYSVPEESRTGYLTETGVSVAYKKEFTIEAHPNENSYFIRWERYDYNNDRWTEASQQASFTTEPELFSSLTDNKFNRYRAVFEKDSFNIDVTVSGIDPELVVIHGAGRYGRGDDATLSFELKDDTHYAFSMWLFDKNNFRTTETLAFEDIAEHHDVEIVFTVNKYAVTATVIPAGAGVVKGQGDYDYGMNYTLTLEPAEGYELKEWRDGVTLDEKSNVLTGFVYGTISIEVELQLKTYTVTATVNDEAMGSVMGSGTYKHGSTVQVGAIPKTGYEFVKWSNGETDNPLFFTVTADTEIQAIFKKEGSDDPTDPDDPTGLDEVVNRQSSIRKYIIDGVLYIIRDGATYNAQGHRMK